MHDSLLSFHKVQVIFLLLCFVPLQGVSEDKFEVKRCVEEAAVIVTSEKDPTASCTVTLTSPIMRDENIPDGGKKETCSQLGSMLATAGCLWFITLTFLRNLYDIFGSKVKWLFLLFWICVSAKSWHQRSLLYLFEERAYIKGKFVKLWYLSLTVTLDIGSELNRTVDFVILICERWWNFSVQISLFLKRCKFILPHY